MEIVPSNAMCMIQYETKEYQVQRSQYVSRYCIRSILSISKLFFLGNFKRIKIIRKYKIRVFFIVLIRKFYKISKMNFYLCNT